MDFGIFSSSLRLPIGDSVADESVFATHRPVFFRLMGPGVGALAWRFAQCKKAFHAAVTEPKPEPPKGWACKKSSHEQFETKWAADKAHINPPPDLLCEAAKLREWWHKLAKEEAEGIFGLKK